MLNCSFLDLFGSKGCFALYSFLIWDTGTIETDWCSSSQHSTKGSDSISVSVAALDDPAFFAKALRFPGRLLIPIIGRPLTKLVSTRDLFAQNREQVLTYGRPLY